MMDDPKLHPDQHRRIEVLIAVVLLLLLAFVAAWIAF